MPKRFMDIFWDRANTPDNRLYLMRSLDSLILSAAIEDAENIYDSEDVAPYMMAAIARLAQGESMALLRKWSVQQFWQGPHAEITRKDFIDGLAELSREDPEAVKDKVKGWQSGRLMKK